MEDTQLICRIDDPFYYSRPWYSQHTLRSQFLTHGTPSKRLTKRTFKIAQGNSMLRRQSAIP